MQKLILKVPSACGPAHATNSCSSHRGFDRKAFRPLEVIFGYSRATQTVKLNFHNLSLHIQAHEELWHSQSHASTALAGRPVAMRESRALILVEDSGNKHAQIPQHLSQTILPNKPSCNTLQNSLRNELTDWHRACRSETARLIRKPIGRRTKDSKVNSFDRSGQRLLAWHANCLHTLPKIRRTYYEIVSPFISMRRTSYV